MIKIDIGNYTKKLSENELIKTQKYLDCNLGLNWHVDNGIISFNQINGLIQKIHKLDTVDCYVVILSTKSFGYLLSDIKALRQFDSTLINYSTANEMILQTSFKPIIITVDHQLSGSGYLLEVINKNLLNKTTTININDQIEIISNIDKSKEKLIIVGLHKFINLYEN